MSVLQRFDRVRQRRGDGAQRERGRRGEWSRQLTRAVRTVKRDMMERVGFAEVARIAADPDAEHAREELRPAVEAALNARGNDELGVDERESVVTEVLDDVVEGTKDGEPLAIVFLKGCERKDISRIADRLIHEKNCGCAAVMNEEENGMMSYVIMSRIISLKTVVAKLNERLSGRGGGRDEIIQGSFQSDEKTIRQVLEELLHGIL